MLMVDANRDNFKWPRRYHGGTAVRDVGAADPISKRREREITPMKSAIEISLYPLTGDYLRLIQAFIDRLNTYPDLMVRTNSLSTQIWGEFGRVMNVLSQEIERSAAAGPQLVFVMKVLPGLSPPAV